MLYLRKINSKEVSKLSRLRLKQCKEESPGIIVCRFDVGGGELQVRGTIDKDTREPTTIEVSSDSPVDPKMATEAKIFTMNQIKARRGEF